MVLYQTSSVDYSTTAPSTFPHRTKMWEYNPMGTFNNNLNSGDIVRFNVHGKEHLDPWSTFLDITIDFSNNDGLLDGLVFKNKVVQLDSSAQSLFKSLVIYESGEEIERIMDYDVLACLLKDISYNTSDRYQRDYEGLGGTFNHSYHNATMGCRMTPSGNNGVAGLPIKFWKPTNDLNQYADRAQDDQFSLQGDETYYTRNHILNMTQSSFQPIYGRGNCMFTANGADPSEFSNSINADAAILTAQDPKLVGSPCAYSPAFGCNGFEPVLSRTVKQRYMKNGFVKTDNIVSMTFQVPLLSSLFGHLMAPNNYKLIPLQYFKDLVFEFQFSPHAFFTSWWNKDSTTRAYSIKSLKLRTELVQISDAMIIAEQDKVYNNGGIRITTQSYYQGPSYAITDGQIPPTLQINLGFESLRHLLFCFIPNDFTANSCCRKQYRLSMGLTSMQIKVGTEYYPQIPIQGNGGTNLGPVNNNEFLKYLWKAFTKLSSPANSTINPHNFAINCRAVDPNRETIDPEITGEKQMCYFEENRVLGKAIYALPLDALNYDNSMLSGLNTTMAKPFELLLKYDNSRVFDRAVQMYTYFYHDIVLYIGPDGIKTHGRT